MIPGKRRFAGLDLGSRSIELVVVEETGRVVYQGETDTGVNPLKGAERLLAEADFEAVLATGYGRDLFESAFDSPTVTEIKAHARGARALFPQARNVLDIGGQDSKAISLFENGRVRKFEMNDRCAAGTGKFLEIMARTLGYEIESFGSEALRAEGDVNISSMCTVFAESEVTSLIAGGRDPGAIAKGVHQSVVRRASGMLNRVSAEGDVVFSGGVARNPCIVAQLKEKLGRNILAPEQPQFVGALGAALLLSESESG